MAVISTSLNQKTLLVECGMPFKYRDKRNAYFRDYMRKRRAEEKRNKEEEDNPPKINDGSEQTPALEKKMTLEIVAA